MLRIGRRNSPQVAVGILWRGTRVSLEQRTEQRGKRSWHRRVKLFISWVFAKTWNQAPNRRLLSWILLGFLSGLGPTLGLLDWLLGWHRSLRLLLCWSLILLRLSRSHGLWFSLSRSLDRSGGWRWLLFALAEWCLTFRLGHLRIFLALECYFRRCVGYFLVFIFLLLPTRHLLVMLSSLPVLLRVLLGLGLPILTVFQIFALPLLYVRKTFLLLCLHVLHSLLLGILTAIESLPLNLLSVFESLSLRCLGVFCLFLGVPLARFDVALPFLLSFFRIGLDFGSICLLLVCRFLLVSLGVSLAVLFVRLGVGLLILSEALGISLSVLSVRLGILLTLLCVAQTFSLLFLSLL